MKKLFKSYGKNNLLLRNITLMIMRFIKNNLTLKKSEVGKKETIKNESLHAIMRDMISRLKRRTRSYSKSEKALDYHKAIALTYGGRSRVNYRIF